MTLKAAIKSGNLEQVKKRLKDNKARHEAIDWAGHYDKLEIVKYLVENGANYTDKLDTLCSACMVGNFNIVKYLVEVGTNIHGYNDYAFRWSCRNGHLELAKYLLEVGANLHAMNNEAFMSEHEDVLEYLNKMLIVDKLKELI